jgi:hypothetical protein
MIQRFYVREAQSFVGFLPRQDSTDTGAAEHWTCVSAGSGVASRRCVLLLDGTHDTSLSVLATLTGGCLHLPRRSSREQSASLRMVCLAHVSAGWRRS